MRESVHWQKYTGMFVIGILLLCVCAVSGQAAVPRIQATAEGLTIYVPEVPPPSPRPRLTHILDPSYLLPTGFLARCGGSISSLNQMRGHTHTNGPSSPALRTHIPPISHLYPTRVPPMSHPHPTYTHCPRICRLPNCFYLFPLALPCPAPTTRAPPPLPRCMNTCLTLPQQRLYP